jgi:hypothetical protein
MISEIVKEDLLFYTILIFMIIASLKIYQESEVFNLKCIISDVDGKKYCVRNRLKLKESADLLASTTNKMTDFVKKLHSSHPSDKRVIRLYKKYDPKKVQETLPTSKLTAYSENKGEKMAFCLGRTKHSEQLIDDHTLTFVYLHELSHVMSISVGHNDEFWTNFKFLLQEAKKMGFHDPKNYKEDNQTYCGMTISDNPYYDH